MSLETLQPTQPGHIATPQPSPLAGKAAGIGSADAVVFLGNGRANVQRLALRPAQEGDLVVEVHWSGISTGTERLLWSGTMPPFPGLQYPLIPGYESVGRVVAAPGQEDWLGDMVFVPGANCFDGAASVFGATASHVCAPSEKVVRLGPVARKEWILLALAATAHHAIKRGGAPDLIIGHGVLGRLAARLTQVLGAPPPTVWETNPDRRSGASYTVLSPADDDRRDYRCIMDLSGDVSAIDTAVSHAAHHASITLAGFYHERPSLAFAPAFMREISLVISAEWTRADLVDAAALIAAGDLDLSGLLTHAEAPGATDRAYATAFTDPACLKMILDWRMRA